MDTTHHLDTQPDDTDNTDDLCTWQTGGSYPDSPPEYCDVEAEPGEEHCTLHLMAAADMAKWETEAGLDDA